MANVTGSGLDVLAAGGGDMFLKIQGSRTGAFKGESRDPAHLDEIQVVAWGWGMSGNASATASSGGRTSAVSQVSARELEVVKRVDSASTTLMGALRNNEMLKEAVLSVRKAGGTNPVEYLKVTLTNARVKSFEIESGAGGVAEALVERITLVFQSITVDYRSQGSTGSSGATSSFTAEFNKDA
ncbi:MAG: type VI secretion system tube protein Hcp [Rhodocyclaceae bacterium]